eukprot:TRINITY_DN81065_c0_g1_i1.p1 TRINITY_DN81065_c0_g1~~TRINITY_DN81065_c0_g1_i1.p1  ORF type:complete len:115 (-),score=20.19 TRINITY_DN81065_c0_g1_i1:49-393(-)
MNRARQEELFGDLAIASDMNCVDGQKVWWYEACQQMRQVEVLGGLAECSGINGGQAVSKSTHLVKAIGAQAVENEGGQNLGGLATCQRSASEHVDFESWRLSGLVKIDCYAGWW